MRDIKLFTLIFACFLFLPGSTVRSQSVNSVFERITIKEGLSQSTVNWIIQDKDGFMWFATYGGVNRYDGYSFKAYQHDENDSASLSYNGIIHLCEDNDGFIWIVNNGNTGLDIYDPKTEKFLHFRNNPDDHSSLSSNILTHVMQDKAGNIWICANNALNLAVREKGKNGMKMVFKRFDNPPGTGSFKRTYEDTKGNLLLFSTTLYYFDRQKNTFINSNVPITTSEVNSVSEDQYGNIFVGSTVDGIIQLVWDNSTSAYSRSDQALINITAQRSFCIVDDQHQVWAGSETGGLFRYDPAHNQLTNFISDKLDARSISDNNIYSLFIDRSGILWIGTYSQGLCKYDLFRKEFVHFKAAPGKVNTMNGNVVAGMHSNNSQELWVGNSDGGGVNRFIFNGDEEPEVVHYTNNPNDNNTIAANNIKGLYQRRNGDVWISTAGFLSKLVPELPGSGRRPSIKRYAMQGWTFEMFEDSRGILWGGTWSGGLWRYNDDTDDFTYFLNDPGNPHSVCDNIIWALGEDDHGNLWIGGHDKGLSILPASEKNKTDPEFIHYAHLKGDSKSLSNNTINVFCQDKEGTMWIGTNEGLCKVISKEKTFEDLSQNNPLSFYSYYKKNGLPSDAIVGIVEGNDGNLWMSTSMGISKFNRADSSFVNYDESDGLQSNEFWHYAYFMNPEGRIFFGGANGFNAFYPKEIIPNPSLPKIVFTDLKIFNKSVRIAEKVNNRVILSKPVHKTSEIVLTHRNNVFTIEYAALHYTQPLKNHYAYYLEGFEKDWNYVGNQRSATYTNLSPGKYVFKVKGTNNDGVWSKAIATLEIRVRPPWWRTWWFRILVLGSIAFIVYRYIMRRIETEKRDKIILQTKIHEGESELKKHKDEIEQQKREILEKEHAAMETNWFNKGMTMVMDIVSKNSNDLNILASELVNVLVQYVGVDVGAFYILNKPKNESPYFEVAGSYAMNGDRMKKVFTAEEGYLGACYKEKEKIVIDNLPEGYILLESGLGKTSLQNLVLMPLVLENDLKGVIELASIDRLPDYKIGLLEKIADNLASSIEIVQMNSRMKNMVDQLNTHMEEVNTQKEEMLQNMEEMKATQEESEKIKDIQGELQQKISAQNEIIKNTESALKKLRSDYDDLLKKHQKAVGKDKNK